MTQPTEQTTTKITLQGGPVGGKLQILIYGDIFEDAFFDEAVSARSIAEILNEHPNVASIEVRINSGGGSVFDGFAIYSLLRQHGAPVDVFIDGIAASSASVVAMAGDTISMSTIAQMMIHNSRKGVFADKSGHRATADVLTGLDEQIAGVYITHTGKSPADTLAQMEAETWFNAKEAVKEGLADNIVDKLDVTASLDLTGYGYRNTPTAFTAHSPGTPPAPPQITAPTPAPTENTDMSKIVAQAAGLNESASEAEIALKVAALKADAADGVKARAEVTAVTAKLGKLTAAIGEEGDKALGAIVAMKVSHAKLAENTAELDGIKAKAETDKHAALVAQGKAEGKLTADLITLFADQSSEQLEAFLKIAPAVVPLGEVTPPKTEDNPTGALTYKDKTFANMDGNEMVALKAADPALFERMNDDFLESLA